MAAVVDDDNDDGEVAAVFSDDEGGMSPPVVPVGSVRPLDLIDFFPLVGGDENFRLSVSLFNSSTLQTLFSDDGSLVALSGTSHGCCFSEFGSILFVIALC